MFKLENEILSVDLPQGHTMQELNVLAREGQYVLCIKH